LPAAETALDWAGGAVQRVEFQMQPFEPLPEFRTVLSAGLALEPNVCGVFPAVLLCKRSRLKRDPLHRWPCWQQALSRPPFRIRNAKTGNAMGYD
jgi:hypothetical protein